METTKRVPICTASAPNINAAAMPLPSPIPPAAMTREYIKLEQEGKSFEELEYLTLGTLRKAVQEGDVKNGTVMAGQIAGLISKEQTCKEMIEEMMGQAEKLLGRC